jgi:putative transposase
MMQVMAVLPHSRKLRAGRVSEIGRAYLVTTVTQGRLPLFADFALARLVVAELRACDQAGLCSTLAFVVMPDHLHWLLQLQTGGLSSLVKRFKSVSGGNVNRQRGTPGDLVWQSGFHDHAIRDGEDLQGIARYVVANPVRAGLVGSARHYPHWDAIWL